MRADTAVDRILDARAAYVRPLEEPVERRSARGLISAIVCTYNRADLLVETLDALKTQHLPEGVRLEILVVDNNSTDNTRQVIDRSAQGSPWPIRYLFEPRQGKSYACNRGIAAAQAAEFLVFTDDDVVPYSLWVYELYRAFREYDADCVGGRIKPFWLSRPPAWMTHPELKPVIWGILAFLDRGLLPLIAQPGQREFLFGANLAFRRDALQQVGTFRTDLGPRGAELLRGDDTDMVDRLIQAGRRVVYAPGAVVAHKVLPERMRLRYFRRRRFSTGKSVARLHPRSGRLVPLWLLRECAANGFAACAAYASGRTVRGIQRELMCWSQLGQIAGSMANGRGATP